MLAGQCYSLHLNGFFEEATVMRVPRPTRRHSVGSVVFTAFEGFAKPRFSANRGSRSRHTCDHIWSTLFLLMGVEKDNSRVIYERRPSLSGETKPDFVEMLTNLHKILRFTLFSVLNPLIHPSGGWPQSPVASSRKQLNKATTCAKQRCGRSLTPKRRLGVDWLEKAAVGSK